MKTLLLLLLFSPLAFSQTLCTPVELQAIDPSAVCVPMIIPPDAPMPHQDIPKLAPPPEPFNMPVAHTYVPVGPALAAPLPPVDFGQRQQELQNIDNDLNALRRQQGQ